MHRMWFCMARIVSFKTSSSPQCQHRMPRLIKVKAGIHPQKIYLIFPLARVGALDIFTVLLDLFLKHLPPSGRRVVCRDEIVELECCRRQNDKWRFHRFLLLLLLLLIGKNTLETREISHSLSASQAECRGFESLCPL
jgi:hypothetical protein